MRRTAADAARELIAFLERQLAELTSSDEPLGSNDFHALAIQAMRPYGAALEALRGPSHLSPAALLEDATSHMYDALSPAQLRELLRAAERARHSETGDDADHDIHGILDYDLDEFSDPQAQVA